MKGFNMRTLISLFVCMFVVSNLAYAMPFNPYKHPVYKKYEKLDKKGGFDAVYKSLQSKDKQLSEKGGRRCFPSMVKGT